jgi:hypothetical protein
MMALENLNLKVKLPQLAQGTIQSVGNQWYELSIPKGQTIEVKYQQ